MSLLGFLRRFGKRSAPSWSEGDCIYVGGHFNGTATFVAYLDDTHALVQLHDGDVVVFPVPVAVRFITRTEQLAAS